VSITTIAKTWKFGKSIRCFRMKPRPPDGLLRVLDELGEDYLYPAKLFLQIELPQAIQKALLPAA
jgi:hypothetical protein